MAQSLFVSIILSFLQMCCFKKKKIKKNKNKSEIIINTTLAKTVIDSGTDLTAQNIKQSNRRKTVCHLNYIISYQ